MHETTVRVNHHTFKVKVAKSPWNKVRGMMFRSWKDVDGMLFPFFFEDRWSIWMPFCPEMDVVWISKDGRVVDVQHAKPMTPNPQTWKVYKPREKCKYVLEVPAGRGKLFHGTRVTLNL